MDEIPLLRYKTQKFVHMQTTFMVERPIVRKEFKLKKHPNDVVRIKIYKRTTKEPTRLFKSLQALLTHSNIEDYSS